MPFLPFILSLSLHVRDPSIQRASSPIFSLLWIFRERKCQFMVGLSVSPVFIPPSSHLSEQSSKESCPLDHWVPSGADCCCRCSAWATLSIPYSHIFDSVNLVCCFFFQLCLHHTPESFAFFFFPVIFLLFQKIQS